MSVNRSDDEIQVAGFGDGSPEIGEGFSPDQSVQGGDALGLVQSTSQEAIDQRLGDQANLGSKVRGRKESKRVKGKSRRGSNDGAVFRSKGMGSKKALSLVVVGVVIVSILGVAGAKISGKMREQEPMVYDYNTSGRYAFDTLLNSLHNFDAELIDDAVGTEDGDSYLAQEWAYVNGVSLREEFIQKVCGMVEFRYPQMDQLDIHGKVMLDSTGVPIQVSSYMNDGESLTVVVPDWGILLTTMEEEKDYILKLFQSSNYSEEDYTWSDELTNLLLQYLCDKASLPSKEEEIVMPVGISDGVPYVKDDAELDKVLFSNEGLREVCKKFSMICTQYDGYEDEVYIDQEEAHNPEYDEWLALFNQYYEADNGVFNRATSRWEPWYLRDTNNEFVLDENGEKIVNYYSIKDEDGNDWIEPDKTILVDVEKIRQVESPWVEETGILYNWIGQWYLQNEYDGVGDVITRVGDGTKERPAGVGTPIITKVKDVDGVYRDVRVSVQGYWLDQDAVDYAEMFSTKNRGLTSGIVQLICYEVKIENLEKESIEFLSSEMTLCDSNSNISYRTGTIYGFTETVTLDAGKSVIINDWGASTELQQKYVCWGKTFGRDYPMVYFKILAGTGDIPTYSAYRAFTGKGQLSGKDSTDK